MFWERTFGGREKMGSCLLQVNQGLDRAAAGTPLRPEASVRQARAHSSNFRPSKATVHSMP
jgi:hypothetical protein